MLKKQESPEQPYRKIIYGDEQITEAHSEPSCNVLWGKKKKKEKQQDATSTNWNRTNQLNATCVQKLQAPYVGLQVLGPPYQQTGIPPISPSPSADEHQL